ncbi:hypothetical protein F5Y19DRAFT_359561 [Xylariaceae sp. FL1651]|nr:hypothetical protein F5Y19DRAFT_359561 [Xylariaceae sp. FL1651]
MAEPLRPPKPKAKNAKFDRIDIWRTEVASSQIYCACSALALQVMQADPCESSRSSMGMASISDLGSSTGAGYSRDSVTTASYPLKEQKRPKFLPSALKPNLSSIAPGEREGSDCPLCASPTDGVAYKWLSNDGSGLVQGWNSPRSISSVKRLEEGGKAKPKKSLLKVVSQVFRRSKRFDLPRGSEVSQPSTTTKNASYSNVQNASKNTTTGTNAIPRMAGTEMYHRLRREAGVDGTGDHDADGSDDTVEGFSDDDRKKPRIGIDASSARLRRAQKLLNKDKHP